MRKTLLSIFVFSNFIIADDHSIAVLDFSGEGIHSDELKTLSDQFRIELLKMDTLQVLDYDDMIGILSDYGYESVSCYTVECGVISAMLLNQEWTVSANVSKIGDAFVCEARLIESETGRVINVATYDYDLSLEGLKSRGMHNLAELLMSTRVPIEVHQRQNLVFVKTEPPGALVRVSRDTLNGKTPIAIDRVTLESSPVFLLKDGFQPYKINQLPNDNSDIIYVELQHLVPQIGDLSFSEPVPNGIVIVSSDGQDNFLIDEGSIKYEKLDAGKYFLESNKYVVINGEFNIKHRRTTQVKPVFYDKAEIRLRKQKYLRNRNILIGSIGATLAFRLYLFIGSEAIYNKYSTSIDDSDSRHKKIEKLDKQKPLVDIVSGVMIFPIVYYHAKYLEMDRWLNQ